MSQKWLTYFVNWCSQMADATQPWLATDIDLHRIHANVCLYMSPTVLSVSRHEEWRSNSIHKVLVVSSRMSPMPCQF